METVINIKIVKMLHMLLNEVICYFYKKNWYFKDQIFYISLIEGF